MVALLAAAATAGKSKLTQEVVSSVSHFVSNLFGGIGGGGGANGMNKRDEARIARATVYALGVKAGSVEAGRYFLGTQASRGAETERQLYDKLAPELAGETMDQARKLGGLQDSDSGKQGLLLLLQLGVGLDIPRMGCNTSTGDPDPACAGTVTQLVQLARAGATSTAKPGTSSTPAPGDDSSSSTPAKAGGSVLPALLVLVGLVVLVQHFRGKL